MKTSNKLLWYGLGGLILFILIFLIDTRVMLKKVIRGDYSENEEIINYTQHTYDFDDFSKLKFQGKFKASIIFGQNYSIRVQEPDNNRFNVETKNYTLYLESQKKHGNTINIEIQMPELKEIRSDGFLKMEIIGFDQNNLKIKNYGAYSIVAENLTVQNLKLFGNGAGAYDFNNAHLTNVDIDFEGMNSCDLSMNGGILSGKTKGVGSLSYNGFVDYLDIDKKGPFVIKSR